MDRFSREDAHRIIDDCLEANPHFTQATLQRLSIMPQRRGKYSGTTDPFINFKLMWFNMRLLNPTISFHENFHFYRTLKFARLIMPLEIFEDDPPIDTMGDEGNYTDLEAGAMKQRDDERAYANELGVLCKDIAWSWDWVESVTEQFHSMPLQVVYRP